MDLIPDAVESKETRGRHSGETNDTHSFNCVEKYNTFATMLYLQNRQVKQILHGSNLKVPL